MIYKLKEAIRKRKILYLIIFPVYRKLLYIFNYLKEAPEKRIYKKQIQEILEKNEIIVKLDFGGLGDSLKYSTLPELLKKQYNIDFYLHESSRDIFRHNDILKLFMKNPYFKGFKESNNPFEAKCFLNDKGNAVDSYEKYLKLDGIQLPKIYYKPQVIHEYENIVLVDVNQVTGLRFNYQYNEESIKIIIANNLDLIDCKVEYIEPSKQDLFRYIDMINSCKYFICFLSGGSVVAAALNKKSSVVIPDNLNIHGKGVTTWLFRKSNNIDYFYKRSSI
jgi:hypothetical protein